MGNSRSVPADSPLGKVLKRWARFSCSPMTKKKMVHYCNTAWPSYALESAGRWPVHGSMDRDTVLQLEQFCQHTGRKDELPYVRAFRALLERESGKGPKKTRHAALSGPNPSHLSSPEEEHPTMPSEPKRVVIPSVLVVGSPQHSSGCPPPAQEEHPTMPSEPKRVVISSVWEVRSPHHSSGCPPPAQEEHPTMPSEPKRVVIPSVWEVRSPHHSSGCPPPAQEEDPTMPSEPKPVVIPSVWVVGSPHHSSGCPSPAQEEDPTMPSEPKRVVIPSVLVVGSPHHSSGCPPPAQEEHPTMPSEPKPVVIPSVWEVGSPHHSSGCPPPAQEEDPTMPSEPKPALILSVWEAGPCNQLSLYPPLPINSNLQYEPGPVTSSVSPYCQTLQGTQFGLGVSVSGAGQFLLRPYHLGNQWPSVEHMAHDLALLKNHRPSYKADPQGMTELFASIFTTYHPSWSYLQTLMDSLLTAGEKILVAHRARQEAGRLHWENPAEFMEANMAVPYGHPLWDPNDGDLPEIEHYRRCILVGLEEATHYYNRSPHV